MLLKHLNNNTHENDNVCSNSEAYSELCQNLGWSFLQKSVFCCQLLTIFSKISIIDVWHGSDKYDCVINLKRLLIVEKIIKQPGDGIKIIGAKEIC